MCYVLVIAELQTKASAIKIAGPDTPSVECYSILLRCYSSFLGLFRLFPHRRCAVSVHSSIVLSRSPERKTLTINSQVAGPVSSLLSLLSMWTSTLTLTESQPIASYRVDINIVPNIAQVDNRPYPGTSIAITSQQINKLSGGHCGRQANAENSTHLAPDLSRRYFVNR
jgi:hypothetical protein